MALQGSERKVLHAILHSQASDAAGYVADTIIARTTGLPIGEIRDCLESLEGKGCIERSVGESHGYGAYVTGKGRQELRRSPPIGFDEGDVDRKAVKVVPKGLRSFDEHDSDFFLELLPGPRRADGLPDSIHFWKA